MELPTGYRLENVWENKTVRLKEEIINFWLHVRALQTRKEAEDRVDQVIFIIRYTNNNIIAVSTVFKQFNKQLNNNFYYFRCFVSREHRRNNLSAVLIVNARDFLNESFITKTNTDVIGMFLVIENEMLKKKRNQAILPYSKCVFVGKNERGDHLRVCYFDDARIS